MQRQLQVGAPARHRAGACHVAELSHCVQPAASRARGDRASARAREECPQQHGVGAPHHILPPKQAEGRGGQGGRAEALLLAPALGGLARYCVRKEVDRGPQPGRSYTGLRASHRHPQGHCFSVKVKTGRQSSLEMGAGCLGIRPPRLSHLDPAFPGCSSHLPTASRPEKPHAHRFQPATSAAALGSQPETCFLC